MKTRRKELETCYLPVIKRNGNSYGGYGQHHNTLNFTINTITSGSIECYDDLEDVYSFLYSEGIGLLLNTTILVCQGIPASGSFHEHHHCLAVIPTSVYKTYTQVINSLMELCDEAIKNNNSLKEFYSSKHSTYTNMLNGIGISINSLSISEPIS